MSKIQRVKTELRSAESLAAALGRLDCQVKQAASLQENTLRLVDFYGNVTMCAAMIDRETLIRKLGIHCYGGLGIVWNGSGFDFATDHYDENYQQYKDLLARIKQEYARAEVISYANATGYTYEEEALPDGTARILLNRR